MVVAGAATAAHRLLLLAVLLLLLPLMGDTIMQHRDVDDMQRALLRRQWCDDRFGREFLKF